MKQFHCVQHANHYDLPCRILNALVQFSSSLTLSFLGCCMIGQLEDVNMGEVYITRGTQTRSRVVGCRVQPRC